MHDSVSLLDLTYYIIYDVTSYESFMSFSYSDQLFTAKSHVENLKRLSNRLSLLENLFLSSRTGETWCVGSALGDVTSQLNCALSLFDAVELPDESLLTSDELTCDENTKRVDEKCRELRETIMLVIQTLYKMRDTNGENCTQDQQTESTEGDVDSVHGCC